LKAHTSLSPIKKDGIEEVLNDEGKPNNISGDFSDIDPNPNFNQINPQAERAATANEIGGILREFMLEDDSEDNL